MELKIAADDKNLETVLDFIHKLLPPDCETDLMYKIDVAAEEIFVNIAHYAYKDKLPAGEFVGGNYKAVSRHCDFTVIEREYCSVVCGKIGIIKI